MLHRVGQLAAQEQDELAVNERVWHRKTYINSKRAFVMSYQ